MGIFLTKGGGNGGNTPTPQKQTYIQDSFDSITIQREETDEYILFDITENALLNRQGHNPNFEIPPQITTFFMWTDFENYGKNSLHVVVHNKKGDCFKLNILPNFSFSEDFPEITIKGDGDIPNDIYFFYDVWTLPNVQNRLIQFYIWSQNADYSEDETYLYVETITDKKNSVPVISEENILQKFYNDEFDFEFDIEPTELINIVGGGISNDYQIEMLIGFSQAGTVFHSPVIAINNKLYVSNTNTPDNVTIEINDPNLSVEYNEELDVNIIFGYINLTPLVDNSNLVFLSFRINGDDALFLLHNSDYRGFAVGCPYWDCDRDEFPFIIQTYGGGNVIYLNSFFADNEYLYEGFLPKFMPKSVNMGGDTIVLDKMFENCVEMVTANLYQNSDNVMLSYFRYCFSGCSKLETATINATLYNTNQPTDNRSWIYDTSYMFYNCTSLKTVEFIKCRQPYTETDMNIDSTTFSGCTSLQEIILNDCSSRFVEIIQGIAPVGVTVTVQ